MIQALTSAPPRTVRPIERPGLQVAIASSSRSGEPRVRVRVDGARAPFRLYLYVDGELAEAWIPAMETSELACPSLATGRHTVTARAIDALGRWGAASLLTPA
jgi:hypothetical protein